MVSVSNKIVKLERKKKMPIKIFTEKCIVNGKRYRKILLPLCGVLEKAQLPNEYLNSLNPAFRWNDSFSIKINPENEPILLLYCCNNTELLSLKIYPENEFQKIISYIRKAGENLKQINQKLKLERWKGVEEFVI